VHLCRLILLCSIVALVDAARGDLITHALARYGDSTLTVDEHFGAANADASLLYTSPGMFHGVASAQSAYGAVTATATVLAVNAAYGVNQAQAESAFADTLTISGPTGVGFVVYTYTVDGWSDGEASLGALFLRHDGASEELSDELAGPEVLTSSPHAITFGQPFNHGVVLQADGGIGLGQTGELGSEFTATMTGLAVFDAAMNPVTGFSISSDSGTAYPIPGPGAVPALFCWALARSSRRNCG
jgi:hypothetical protein